MLQRLHRRLGTAGLAVAVVALIAALGGTALAASGALTGKQKKEVEKIAKKFAGKPGAPGAPGVAGANGTNGKDGTNGTAGAPGKGGESVTLAAAGACPNGGTKATVGAVSKEICNGEPGSNVELAGTFTGPQETPSNAGPCQGAGGSEYEVEGGPGPANIVCNGTKGAEGKPWAPSGSNILPEGATITGAWAFNGTTADTEGVYVPISFPFRLASSLGEEEVHYVTQEEVAENTKPAACPGNMNFPAAVQGNLCVYESNGFEAVKNATFGGIVDLSNAGEFGASRTGAFLLFNMTGVGRGDGAWALTAPVSGP